jgi:hypothetical protein
MDFAGLNWVVIDIVAVAVLAIVLLWVMLRNKSKQEEGLDRTEQATRKLYQEEDAARDPMDDGVV